MKTNILLYLGSELQKKRSEKGYSRSDLCDELAKYGLFLSEDTIKTYESGKRNMKASTLIILMHILKLDLGKLLSEIPMHSEE